MITIKNQNFGVEIELTGIKRAKAADVIASYFGTTAVYLGTGYDTHGAPDRKGRVWKAMCDGSIRTTRKVDGREIDAPAAYSCEVVTPILQYDDIPDLQEIIRRLVSAGAVANESCGIHVHVDGINHTPQSLKRLLNFAIGRQDLFYEALGIGRRADRWCHKVPKALLNAMKSSDDLTRDNAERIWYSRANDGYTGGISHEHYNSTRYHGINLHAFFTKGTIEFRLFNGTTHAGKIKAYVQFCLAMSAWAITAPDKMYYKSCAGYTQEQKKALMLRVLKNRLGMKGKEFKTARTHLTSAFTAAADQTTAA